MGIGLSACVGCWSSSTGMCGPGGRMGCRAYRPGSVRWTRTRPAGFGWGWFFLLGGARGLGKSTWALQVARHVAAGGHGRALYVCYEHSEEFLLERLMAMESALDGDGEPISVGDLRNLLAAWAARAGSEGGRRDIGDLLAEIGPAQPVLQPLGGNGGRAGCGK